MDSISADAPSVNVPQGTPTAPTTEAPTQPDEPGHFESIAEIFALDTEGEILPHFALEREGQRIEAEFRAFVATLPPRIQEVNVWDLRHIWGIAKRNAQIALNLQTRHAELMRLFNRLTAELNAKGFLLADVIAFERYERDASVFPRAAPYVVPSGYDSYGYRETAEHDTAPTEPEQPGALTRTQAERVADAYWQAMELLNAAGLGFDHLLDYHCEKEDEI